MRLSKRIFTLYIFFIPAMFLFSQQIQASSVSLTSEGAGREAVKVSKHKDAGEKGASQGQAVSKEGLPEKADLKVREAGKPGAGDGEAADKAGGDVKAVLPRGYRGILLGMSLDTTKTALIDRPEFGYHGERDVSLLPGENRMLIETDAESGHGSDFLRECYFQFFNDYLYIITININRERMDYYSMFTTLTDKYGNPVDLNPHMAKWENDTTIVYLEKPLTLKYIDKDVFEETNSASQIDLGPVELTRDIFLEDL